MTNLQPFAENDRQLAPVTWQGGPSTGDLDYALPRLILMQAGSPQLKSHPGVQAGQLLHSVTGEVLRKPPLLAFPTAVLYPFTMYASML